MTDTVQGNEVTADEVQGDKTIVERPAEQSHPSQPEKLVEQPGGEREKADSSTGR